MTARWWDGCTQLVVSVSKKKLDRVTHGPVNLLKLECGHSQKAASGAHVPKVGESVICFGCSDAR